jgi:hypothetical protein
MDFCENVFKPLVSIETGDLFNRRITVNLLKQCTYSVGVSITSNMLFTGIRKLMGVDDSLFGAGNTRTQVLQMALAELVGTGILVFLGCMGTVVGMSHSAHPHLLVALAFGLTVMIAIQVGACKTVEATTEPNSLDRRYKAGTTNTVCISHNTTAAVSKHFP